VDDVTSALQKSIFRSKVERARARSPGDKLAEAADLFDETLALMRDAIATDHPEYDMPQVQAEVLRRLRIARRLDEAGWFRSAGRIDD
jgi:hypothetical protein